MSTLPRLFRVSNSGPAIADLETAFDRLLNREFNGCVTATTYPVDVREDQSHFYIEAELPGFTKEQVQVTVEDQTLTISASRQSQDDTETKTDGAGTTYIRRERSAARYQRSFALPPTVDDSSVAAKLEHGVLTVTLNKRDEVKPRQIPVL